MLDACRVSISFAPMRTFLCAIEPASEIENFAANLCEDLEVLNRIEGNSPEKIRAEVVRLAQWHASFIAAPKDGAI